MKPSINTWQDVETEVLARIHSREWKPGHLIPNESDLAQQFGCARTTVNRALRSVAEAGYLDRKRKAGTRVTTHPVRKATLNIPIIRQEIEARNQAYSFALVSSKLAIPPTRIQAQMKLASDRNALHITAIHMADGQPYACEDRWINIDAVPAILDIDLSAHNANEWLVANAPFTRGDISFSAAQADEITSESLNAAPNQALFVLDRATWNGEISITSVRLTFHPGYRMHTHI